MSKDWTKKRWEIARLDFHKNFCSAMLKIKFLLRLQVTSQILKTVRNKNKKNNITNRKLRIFLRLSIINIKKKNWHNFPKIRIKFKFSAIYSYLYSDFVTLFEFKKDTNQTCLKKFCTKTFGWRKLSLPVSFEHKK